MVEWLKERQNKENGTWEKDFDMTAVNGVLKICGFFDEEPFPCYELYINNVIDFTKTFKPTTAAAAWNPMGSLRAILRLAKDYITPTLKAKLDESIAEMIENTTEIMRMFRQPDSGFGYRMAGSSPYSNDVKVSEGFAEGDVNALALMALIYDEAYALSGTESSAVWRKYKDYFWSELKKKRDEATH